MTRENIIRMAREACDTDKVDAWHNGFWTLTQEELERFAALVATAERERIIAANAPEIEKVNAHIKALGDAVAAEREACAKVCEEHWEIDGTRTAKEFAAAIRARGQA